LTITRRVGDATNDMKPLVRCSLCLILLAIATHLTAAGKAETAFTIRLAGVKFDYPGFEHWAEIERPDGKHEWAFAIYTGAGEWSVPFSADAAGKYRLLRVERRRGDQREDDVIAKNSQLELEVNEPRKLSQPQRAEKPLVEAGGFKTFFTAEEPWCVNDHTFVQGPDKTWHLFGITHPKPLIWDKDPGHRLCHVTAQTLSQTPWQAQPPAVARDWEKYREFVLWAPYVVQHDGTYYMFVCVGDKDTHRYRIHLLTSPDLKEWTRSADNPMVVDGFDGRDPFVMRVGEEWVLYYTANSTPECGNHQVVSVTSKDLTHWSNRKVVFTHPRAGSFGGPTESPFIVRRGDNYYLFVCDNEWTDVYVSRDPFHWDFDQKNTRILSHASEIVRDTDGNWFISHAGWTGGPLRIAPLKWNDGLDDAPTNILPAAQ
jgi:beta-fructofuranosidase